MNTTIYFFYPQVLGLHKSKLEWSINTRKSDAEFHAHQIRFCQVCEINEEDKLRSGVIKAANCPMQGAFFRVKLETGT
jgi:hypothetical protein